MLLTNLSIGHNILALYSNKEVTMPAAKKKAPAKKVAAKKPAKKTAAKKKK